MKKLKENLLSFNLIKQKLRDLDLHFLFSILIQPKTKIQEAHKLVQLVLGGITLTKPNSKPKFQFKDEINSNKSKSSPKIKNRNVKLEKCFWI